MKYKYVIVKQGLFDWRSEEQFINKIAQHSWRLVTITINPLTNETKFYFEKIK